MTTLIILPYDATSVASTNLVVGEQHTPTPGSHRLILPEYGAYYTKSLVVYGVVNGSTHLLYRGFDYTCTDYHGDLTHKTAQEVCASIIVTDQSYDDFSITYQAVGGSDSVSKRQLQELTDLIEQGEQNITVNFDDIEGKPFQYTAAVRDTLAENLFNLGLVCDAIDNITKMVWIGNSGTNQELKNSSDSKQHLLRNDVLSFLQIVDIHQLPVLVFDTSQAQLSVNQETFVLSQLINNTSIVNARLSGIWDMITSATSNRKNVLAAAAGLIDQKYTTGQECDMLTPTLIPGCMLYLNTYTAGYLIQDDEGTHWIDRSAYGRAFTDVSSRVSVESNLHKLTGDSIHFDAGHSMVLAGTNIPVTSKMTVFVVLSVNGMISTGIDLLAGPRIRIRSGGTNGRVFELQVDDNVVAQSLANTYSNQTAICMDVVLSEDSDIVVGSNNSLSHDPCQNTGYTANGLFFDRIGSSASINDRANIQALVVYNRELCPSEMEAVRKVLKRITGCVVNQVPNPNFDFGNVGFSSNFAATLSVNPGAVLSTQSYRDVFAQNPAIGDTGAQPYTASWSNKLMVRGGSQTHSVWRATCTAMDVGALYYFDIDVVHGQINPPTLSLVVNGQSAGDLVLDYSKGYNQGVRATFVAPADICVFEIFNTNLSQTGNTFCIDQIVVQRDIFCNA